MVPRSGLSVRELTTTKRGLDCTETTVIEEDVLEALKEVFAFLHCRNNKLDIRGIVATLNRNRKQLRSSLFQGS